MCVVQYKADFFKGKISSYIYYSVLFHRKLKWEYTMLIFELFYDF